ncbi:hypothetical protein GCM10007390_09490 [Persicitalea jodogahamensis]|uniref:Uncharacterized protein n=1 Tax=Persicitalea jodogahamensis TaxID=402147 RepID=A0A8J3G7N8_9BACT|nr:hypothetical protein GCM10007390_09490 [Persicitalea jodogahamensis]
MNRKFDGAVVEFGSREERAKIVTQAKRFLGIAEEVFVNLVIIIQIVVQGNGVRTGCQLELYALNAGLFNSDLPVHERSGGLKLLARFVDAHPERTAGFLNILDFNVQPGDWCSCGADTQEDQKIDKEHADVFLPENAETPHLF